MDEVGGFEGRERVGHGWGGGDRHCCDVGFYLMKGWRGVRCFKVGHGWGGIDIAVMLVDNGFHLSEGRGGSGKGRVSIGNYDGLYMIYLKEG